MEPSVSDFTLPELGENISAGDVLRVLVKPGDTIAMEQPVLELETDKATIEVPSSVAGTVGQVNVKPGDKVKVGQVILTVNDTGKVNDSGKAEGQKAGGQEAKAGKAERQEGREGQEGRERLEAREEKAGRTEGKRGRAEEDDDAVGANTAAKVPGDEPGLEQHVEGERRDTGDKTGTMRE